MLSTRKCIRPRSLHPPTAWVCNQPMNQTPIVSRDRSSLPTLGQYSNPNVSPRRAFSWGKRRHWNCSHNINPYRLLEARSRTWKGSRCVGIHHNYLDDRGHSNYRYFSNRGWWLSSTGGRPGYGWGESSFLKSSKLSEEAQEEWYKMHLKRKADVEKSFDDFQRKVDADPYGALFGWRLGKEPYPDSKSANENITSKENSSPGAKHCVDDPVSKPGQAAKDQEQETQEEWYKLYLKGKEDVEKSFEALKRKVDADPYGSLFGWKLGKSSYADKSANENTTSKKHIFSDESKQCVHGTVSKPSQTGKDHIQESESCLRPSYPEAKASFSHDNQVEEFVFDPITMRKVPKKPSRPVPDFKKNATLADGESSIPVKRFTKAKPLVNENSSPFQPPEKTTSKQSYPPETTGAVPASRSVQPQRSWLVQEGLGTQNPVNEPFRPGPQSKQSTKDDYPKTSKIESSLDRHLRSKRTTSENSGTDHPALKYKAEQNTIEDIDLLRASDVRASAGLGGRSPKETRNTKQEKRKVLENDYEMRQKLDTRLAEEVATKPWRAKTSASLLNKSSDCEAEVRSSVESARGLNRLREQHQSESENRKKNAAKSALEEEIKVQRSAMEAAEMHRGREAKPAKAQRVHYQESGEGDMASNVHEFVDRDRWYKQRAPHAIKESELKLRQKVKDMALIREIRSVYEDEYGTITTHHRQPSRQVDRRQKAENTQNARDPTSSQPSSSQQTSAPYKSSAKRAKEQPERPEVLKIIQKSIAELCQARYLFRKNYNQYPNAVVPNAFLRSSATFEQFFIQTLKGALELLEPGVETSAGTAVGTRKPDIPATAAAPAVSDSKASSTTKPLAPSKSSTPTFYKILAYDPSSQRVSAAKTTSTTTAPDENPLTLVEALSKLVTPAKFLPHFASLQNSGYEVVSAGANILIFRKFGSAKQPTLHVTEDASFATTEKYPRHTNPIDGTTTRTGNFASPTGFVNHDAILPPSEEDGRPPPPFSWQTKADDKVTRQEEVFSGSHIKWQDDRGTSSSSTTSNNSNKMNLWKKQRRARRRKRILKRMLKLGVLVAVNCYLLGLVSELARS